MPTLTVDQIVTAAIALLDEEGLDGLNMRSLGRRLDCVATAVYWHVKTKDDVVRLAADAVWDEIALPDLDAQDWRTSASDAAVELHAMLGRHPWLVQAFGSHLLYGPGKSRHDDHLLGVYEKAGFVGVRADEAAAAVFTYVLGNALGAAAQLSLTRRLGKGGKDAEAQLAEGMREAVGIAGQFPRLRERIEGADYAGSPGDSFTFGLEALLDGLDAAR